MQKHRQKHVRQSPVFRNGNSAISEAARSSIIGILDSIDGGEDFATTYLRAEFLSKFCDDSVVSSSVRRENAIRKFLDCEQVNRSTNQMIRDRDPGFNILPRVSYASFLRFVRRLTRDILGPLRDEVVLGSFSGGASTSRPRTHSHPAMKFVGKADLTEGAEKFLDILYREAPLLRQYGTFNEINFVAGNVLFTVPKKTDIDRCACKEPDVNMFLQKGVGNHIRRRLRHFNINLNDQSVNRGLAKEGSISGCYATLDLSSASDTLSYEVVKAILPYEWFEYLNDIRSHSVRIDDETYRLEMFSSMGNGFTFELESMIFFVLMRAVAYFEGISGRISVYGDDIIIPVGMADLATFVLQKFGFTVNTDKSYSTGPFRESCGGHYYLGEDVTPFYLKRAPTRLVDVIRVANQLRRWAFADSSRRYSVKGVYHAWYTLASLVPRELWGGYDFSVDTQLVAPVAANKKLVRVSEPQRLNEQGQYLLWHNSNWNRTSEGLPSEKPVSTNQICRRRRANPGAPACRDYFYEELVSIPVSA